MDEYYAIIPSLPMSEGNRPTHISVDMQLKICHLTMLVKDYNQGEPAVSYN